MAHVLRLIGVLLWVAAGGASAAVPLQPAGGRWTTANLQGVPLIVSPTFTGPADGASGQSACGVISGTFTYTDGPSQGSIYWSAGAGACVVGGYGPLAVESVPAQCPANSTPAGSACQCSSGFVEGTGSDLGKCVPVPPAACPTAGLASEDVTWTSSSSEATYNFCENGAGSCGMYARPSICFRTGSGVYECSGTSYFTGSRPASCSGSGSTPEAPAPNKPPPAPCPAGQQPGTVNGVTLCAPVGTDKPSEAPAPGNGSSEVKKPDGSAVQTTQSGTTSCSGGTCTTTTTNNTVIINKPGDTSCPSGTTQGTTTKDGQTVTTCTSSSTSSSSQSQTGYCKGSGAGTAQCGGEGSGSSFGGNCAAGFKAVSEDAVLNAMAEEQWRRNCQFFDKVPEDTEESLAYADMKAKGKAGVDQTNDLPAGSKREITIGPGDFDSSNALGGAACITDRTIVVMGRSISLPFSQLCVWLGYMGTVLLACSYLVAARIVMGAK